MMVMESGIDLVVNNCFDVVCSNVLPNYDYYPNFLCSFHFYYIEEAILQLSFSCILNYLLFDFFCLIMFLLLFSVHCDEV